MQLSLKAQHKDGRINQNELKEGLQIWNKIKSVLYKFSEGRLMQLSMMLEFRMVIKTHRQRWGNEGLDMIENGFYSKIIILCEKE